MKVIIADYDEEAIRLFEEQCKQFSYVELSGKFNDSAESKREKADYKRFFSIVNKHLVFYSEGSGFYKYRIKWYGRTSARRKVTGIKS